MTEKAGEPKAKKKIKEDEIHFCSDEPLIPIHHHPHIHTVYSKSNNTFREKREVDGRTNGGPVRFVPSRHCRWWYCARCSLLTRVRMRRVSKHPRAECCRCRCQCRSPLILVARGRVGGSGPGPGGLGREYIKCGIEKHRQRRKSNILK